MADNPGRFREHLVQGDSSTDYGNVTGGPDAEQYYATRGRPVRTVSAGDMLRPGAGLRPEPGVTSPSCSRRIASVAACIWSTALVSSSVVIRSSAFPVSNGRQPAKGHVDPTGSRAPRRRHRLSLQLLVLRLPRVADEVGQVAQDNLGPRPARVGDVRPELPRPPRHRQDHELGVDPVLPQQPHHRGADHVGSGPRLRLELVVVHRPAPGLRGRTSHPLPRPAGPPRAANDVAEGRAAGRPADDQRLDSAATPALDRRVRDQPAELPAPRAAGRVDRAELELLSADGDEFAPHDPPPDVVVPQPARGRASAGPGCLAATGGAETGP